MEAKFNLLVNTGGGPRLVSYSEREAKAADLRVKVSVNGASPQFKFPNRLYKIGIHPGSFIEEEEGVVGFEEYERNRKRCLDLESQLAKVMDQEECSLTLKFKANLGTLQVTQVGRDAYGQASVSIRNHEGVESMDLSLVGEALGKLYSTMMYGLGGNEGRLNLKLSGVLVGVGHFCYTSRHPYFKLHFDEALRPHINDDGSWDHCKYVIFKAGLTNAFGASATRMMVDPSVLDPEMDYWELTQVQVTIDGILPATEGGGGLGAMDAAAVAEEYMLKGSKKIILGSGLGADLKIIGRDGVTVPCHSDVLIGESSVIAVKMSGRFEKDAGDPTIDMRDRSKEEITAFLEFLYYGGRDKALENPALAMALYEMGRYYFVPKLEHAMEALLLTRSSEWFSAEDGLQLMLLAEKNEKREFQRKAVDVLGIRSDDEIGAAEIFPEVFKSAEAWMEFVVWRKRF